MGSGKMKLAGAIIACIGAVGLIIGMTACSKSGSVFYANANRYSVGDARLDETIENIDIDWVSGRVNIVTHADGTVLLEEKTDSFLTDDMRLHWWLDGTTLRIRFCAAGVRLQPFRGGEKELTIALPESMELADMTINTASADVSADRLIASRLSVSTASGEMSLICEADQIDLGSTSGDIMLRQIGKTALARVHTTSGEIESDFEQCERADIDSVSGRINASTDKATELSVKSTSGNVACTVNGAISRCTLRTVSGRATLSLPDGMGFTAKVDTVSGDFSSGPALKRDGRVYTCGDGSAEISIKTTSGDISVEQTAQ